MRNGSGELIRLNKVFLTHTERDCTNKCTRLLLSVIGHLTWVRVTTVNQFVRQDVMFSMCSTWLLKHLKQAIKVNRKSTEQGPFNLKSKCQFAIKVSLLLCTFSLIIKRIVRYFVCIAKSSYCGTLVSLTIRIRFSLESSIVREPGSRLRSKGPDGDTVKLAVKDKNRFVGFRCWLGGWWCWRNLTKNQ